MSLNDHILRPKIITIEQFTSFSKEIVYPIDGLKIPNILVPKSLVGKSRPTEINNTLSINIRKLFNGLTNDNIEIIKNQLQNIILTEVKDFSSIKEIADEILSNFLISDQHIEKYILLLNTISTACVKIPDPNNVSSTKMSPTIGTVFLNKCRDLIFGYIKEENIRKLALLDEENLDEQDVYNRERSKISNLIITICYLYGQRNTNYIRLCAPQIYEVINTLINNYVINNTKMKKLGNPYNDEECKDEREFEILKKMCSLYAENLYIFMVKKGSEINNDPQLVKNKLLKTLIIRFKSEVVPSLTEAYLISNCETLKY